MGACASKPNTLDNADVPAPVEQPISPKAEAVAKETIQGGEDNETKEEKPLVDLSEAEATTKPAETAEEETTAGAAEEAKADATEAVVDTPNTEEKKGGFTFFNILK
ncbi:hypothetical protein Leryth_016845 [Lithospermum erythrorhizon]|uniref:Uncharacterized protein n=1 Tax=Lithospermum erythrorhizon TaxID=34254 RepID=A0AAV3QGS5_LITER|nr:hypothetical protein Leryth_016845 [Lithospermum erythrorhizon]